VVDLTLNGSDLDPTQDLIWIIGDSEVDLDCAINSGCKPILFGGGKNISDTLKERSLHFKNHQEILEYFKND